MSVSYCSFVGGLGIGPKYLLDEYAVYDTRYWVLNDPMTAWITYQEVAIMLPLEYLWYTLSSPLSPCPFTSPPQSLVLLPPT